MRETAEYRIRKPSFFRRLAMEAFDAFPAAHSMTALVELDVTDARKALRRERRNGRSVSLLSLVIRSIALAIAENRELNSIRDRGRIVEFRDVDVNMPVELKADGEHAPRQIVIRNADGKTVDGICREIDEAKTLHRQSGSTGREDTWALGMMRVLLMVPKGIRKLVVRSLVGNPHSVKKMSGTTFVTSVGMFGTIPGFIIPYMPGPRAVSFALGSIVRKPVPLGEEVLVREILSMTITFNHDLVDGAPAARFTNRLKKIIEHAEVL